VLFPPCIRQRPLGIAGALQDLPVRLECAPHRGAARANSRRASRLGACGSLAIFAIPPPDLVSAPTTLTPDLGRNDRLTTVTNMHMLDRNDLAAAGSSPLQGKETGLVSQR
jgi:hypothetical protein